MREDTIMRRTVMLLAAVAAMMVMTRAYAQPVYGTAYTSTSGSVYVRHGYAINFSGAGAATSATQSVAVPSCLDERQIFLTGFSAKYTQAGSPQNVRVFRVGVETIGCSTILGTPTFQWRAFGTVQASSGSSEAWSIDLHFVIVLTKSADAHVAAFSSLTSCTGTSAGSCNATTTLTGAAPSGMDFAGVGIQYFQVQRTDGSAGIPIHQMAVDLTNNSVSGTDVSLTHTCAFGDATPAGESMACTVWAATLAAKTGETDNFAPTYTDSALASEFSDTDNDSAGGTNIVGVLGGLAAWDLSFDSNGQHTLWKWKAGFTDISLTAGSPDLMNHTRTGFLGDTWNSTSTSAFTVVNDLLKVFVL
jgi:hypothetical protein